MDEKYWFYLIIGIIYALTRLFKKKEPEAQRDEPRSRPSPSTPHQQPSRTITEKPKQLTFEELLREIQEAKQAQKPAYETTVAPEYVDYDDDLKDEAQDLETIDDEKRKFERANLVYEEAKRQAFVRPSLEETMSNKDTSMVFAKFDVFDQQKKKTFLDEYMKDLKDPAGLKKAVVMAEILNRKF
jgi:hypothetical protein